MTTNRAIATANDAYDIGLSNHLYDLCNFDEDEDLPEEYHEFERLIAENSIDAELIPFSEHKAFYLFGNPDKLHEVGDELEAYFMSMPDVEYAHICEDQRIFFVGFREMLTDEQGSNTLLTGFGYVLSCIEQEQEIIKGLPF